MISRDSVLNGYAFTVRTDTGCHAFRVTKKTGGDLPKPLYFVNDETNAVESLYVGLLQPHSGDLEFTRKSLEDVHGGA